jgi:acetyl esterase
VTRPAEPVLSEQARALLGPQRAAPAWERDMAAQRRDARARGLQGSGLAEPLAAMEEFEVGSVPVRLYRPRGGEREVFVWFHGGGWSLGDLDSYDALCAAVANRVGCAVASVDYRLAPEDPYPAGLEDCWAATRWAAERFERIAVGGDSAGGNLAAAVALRARDVGLELALQLLVYPVLDPGLDSAFVEDFVVRYQRLGDWRDFGRFSRLRIRRRWEQYVTDPARLNERDAAPLRAPSLAGVAPAFVILVEHDVLRGEGEQYVERLRAEGVRAKLHCYCEQVHGFYSMVGTIDDARDAVERSAAALRHAFAAVGDARADTT